MTKPSIDDCLDVLRQLAPNHVVEVQSDRLVGMRDVVDEFEQIRNCLRTAGANLELADELGHAGPLADRIATIRGITGRLGQLLGGNRLEQLEQSFAFSGLE